MITVLTAVALGAMLFFALQLLIVAFRTSPLWGVSLLIPLGVFVFVALHWEEAKAPFLRFLLALAAGIALRLFGSHAVP